MHADVFSLPKKYTALEIQFSTVESDSCQLKRSGTERNNSDTGSCSATGEIHPRKAMKSTTEASRCAKTKSPNLQGGCFYSPHYGLMRNTRVVSHRGYFSKNLELSRDPQVPGDLIEKSTTWKKNLMLIWDRFEGVPQREKMILHCPLSLFLSGNNNLTSRE